MRNIVWFLLAAILLFATCSVQAQHCSVAPVQAYSAQQQYVAPVQTYVAPVQAYVAPAQSYNAAVTYYPTYYPVYSVSYRGADEGGLREELLRLKIELQQLQIQQLKFQGAVPEVLPLKASMLSQKCAACHDERKAKASGDGFVMFRAGQLTINAEQKLKAIKMVSTGKMPKGGPRLTEEEAGAVIGELLE